MTRNLLLILVALIREIVSDLPIHCLNSQVAGLWKFQLTKPSRLESPLMNNCGHMMPDHERSSYMALKQQFPSLVYKEMNIKLSENGQVDTPEEFSQRNNNAKLNDFISSGSPRFRFKTMKKTERQVGEVGDNWSMIYDEGYELRMENLRMVLFN